MTKKGDKLSNLKTTIQRILEKSESYKPELTYQVELLASSILFYRKVRQEILDEGFDIKVIETSREGQSREKLNPTIDAFIKMDIVVRRNLAALYMNRAIKRDTLQVTPEDKDDALSQIMGKMNDIGE